MHLQPVFADSPFYGNDEKVSEKLFDEGLCLPSHPGLTDQDMERIVGVITRLAVFS
jgi:dTDP-4-amino-4,6-dideoxygalactose transaminase